MTASEIFTRALEVTGWGVLGVFVILAIIYGSVTLLMKIMPAKEEKSE
ncbi:MAG: hypothetical protein ACOYI4_02285 [Christensenellales bacterium]|jgi:hypothetical protein